MKNIFFFLLGIVFMGAMSVYQVPKGWNCNTVVFRKVYKSGKLLSTAESKDGFYVTDRSGDMRVDRKSIGADSVAYVIKYK